MLVIAAPRAEADDSGAALPVVAGGREADMLALASPFVLGSDLAAGWHLENITASQTAIRYLALGPGGAKAAVRLEHPKRAPSSEITPSFAVHREVEKGNQGGAAPDPKVLDPLVDAIRKNDKGTFWPIKGPSDRQGDGRGGGGTGDSHRESHSTEPDAPATLGAFPTRRVILVAGLLVVLAMLLVGRRKKSP